MTVPRKPLFDYLCENPDGFFHALKDADADLNAIDDYGTPLLVAACLLSSPDIALALIQDIRTDINAKDADGCTPLMMSASKEKTQIVEALLKREDVRFVSEARIVSQPNSKRIIDAHLSSWYKTLPKDLYNEILLHYISPLDFLNFSMVCTRANNELLHQQLTPLISSHPFIETRLNKKDDKVNKIEFFRNHTLYQHYSYQIKKSSVFVKAVSLLLFLNNVPDFVDAAAEYAANDDWKNMLLHTNLCRNTNKLASLLEYSPKSRSDLRGFLSLTMKNGIEVRDFKFAFNATGNDLMRYIIKYRSYNCFKAIIKYTIFCVKHDKSSKIFDNINKLSLRLRDDYFLIQLTVLIFQYLDDSEYIFPILKKLHQNQPEILKEVFSILDINRAQFIQNEMISGSDLRSEIKKSYPLAQKNDIDDQMQSKLLKIVSSMKDALTGEGANFGLFLELNNQLQTYLPTKSEDDHSTKTFSL